MIGAGTIISPIIKVVTTVAILAAIYFLIVRPILDTTEDISRGVRGNIEQSHRDSAQQSRQAEIQSTRSSATSYANSLLAGSQPWPKASKAVLHCVRQAGESVSRLSRCEALGQSIASKVLSDRNFASSYADNLATQGRKAEAAQVRSCIEDARFDAGSMAKCRALADDLLFG